MALRWDYPPETRLERPQTTEEKRELVKAVYAYKGNEWGKQEHFAFCHQEKLPLKALDVYTNAELDKFLTIFEKEKMVLFK